MTAKQMASQTIPSVRESFPSAPAQHTHAAGPVPTPECDGWLQLDGWHGRSQQRVRIVGETPKKFRIMAIAPTRLGGRNRSLAVGQIGLVPKRAVTFAPLTNDRISGDR